MFVVVAPVSQPVLLMQQDDPKSRSVTQPERKALLNSIIPPRCSELVVRLITSGFMVNEHYLVALTTSARATH